MPNPNVGLNPAWGATTCEISGDITVRQAEYNQTAPYNGRGSLIQFGLSCTGMSDDTGAYMIDECPIIANVLGSCINQYIDSSEVGQDLSTWTKGQYCWCTIPIIGTDSSPLSPISEQHWWNARTLGPSFTTYDACINGCRDICVSFVRTRGLNCPMLQWAIAQARLLG